MTNAEAIKILRFIKPTDPTSTVGTAYDMAISALGSQLEWNSADNPPDSERNIFICHGSSDFKAPCIGHYDLGMKMYYEDKNWFASPMFDAMYWCEMPRVPVNDKKEDT